MRTRKRWAVFISGTGSNLGVLLDLRDRIDVACVVSSRASAAGILKARRAGVPTVILHKEMSWESLTETLQNHRVNAIFLAGFMKIIPEGFLHQWRGRIWNVHPSLLPAYPGLNSIARAYENQARIGATVHEVIEIVDGGKIVMQGAATGGPFSNLEDAEFGVHLTEHRLLREVVGSWKSGPM